MIRHFDEKVPKIDEQGTFLFQGDTQGVSPWENFGYFLSLESNPPEAEPASRQMMLSLPRQRHGKNKPTNPNLNRFESKKRLLQVLLQQSF